MASIARLAAGRVQSALARRRSVLLLGPRQTGKTTLLATVGADLTLNLLRPDVRLRYERDPALFSAEVEALAERTHPRRPLVAVDEVQRVPDLVDAAQDLIDRRVAVFVLTGSSARRLRRGTRVNLLPGRLLPIRLDPLSMAEHAPASLDEALNFGSLPRVALDPSKESREEELRAYTTLYLDEEVRAEALVRNLGHFSRFLQLAALESGQVVHYRGLAQELGLTHTTVTSYYEILEDCLIAERVMPISESRTRKKLTKSPRYLFFDLGVRRAAADEAVTRTPRVLGQLFEQFVGLELLRAARLRGDGAELCFWRDPDGPELDWVLKHPKTWLPIEVKWSDAPSVRDARHLETFLDEYPKAARGVVVCRTPRPLKLTARVTAVPWQEIPRLVDATAS